MKKEREAVSDVQLSEDLSHVAELPREGDFMEVNGTMVLGEAQGNDLCLLLMAWRVGGGKQGKWRVDDALVGQTTFVMIPQDQRGRMHDNDFISNRQDPTEWIGDIQIMEEPDKITWQHGNRQYISRPPYWELKGEHLGVECNLLMGGLGKADRVYGPWSSLATDRRAGYDQRCWVEGTITVGGRTYTLEKGYAAHEVMTFGNTWDHTKNMREPYNWIFCMSEAMQIFIWFQPGAGVGYGCVYTDGKEIRFKQSEINIDELDWWVDPKTFMRVPCRWHVNMNSASGIVDMIIDARGRAIFCVMTRTGYTMRYSNIARTNGRVFLPDRPNVPIQDMITYSEWGAYAMPLEGGAQ